MRARIRSRTPQREVSISSGEAEGRNRSKSSSSLLSRISLLHEFLQPVSGAIQPHGDGAPRGPQQFCDLRVTVVMFVAKDQNLHSAGVELCEGLEKLSLKLSLIHISEPTRLLSISYAVFCL